jgi:hypothetical protein
MSWEYIPFDDLKEGDMMREVPQEYVGMMKDDVRVNLRSRSRRAQFLLDVTATLERLWGEVWNEIGDACPELEGDMCRGCITFVLHPVPAPPAAVSSLPHDGGDADGFTDCNYNDPSPTGESSSESFSILTPERTLGEPLHTVYHNEDFDIINSRLDTMPRNMMHRIRESGCSVRVCIEHFMEL